MSNTNAIRFLNYRFDRMTWRSREMKKIHTYKTVILASITCFSLVSIAFSALSSQITIQITGSLSGYVTHNAASGSAADIQTAINWITTHGGIGMVIVPAGTWNWVNQGESWRTVEVPGGVTVSGAGVSGSDAYGLGIPATWSTVLVDAYDSGGRVDSEKVWFEISGQSPRICNLKIVGYRNSHTSSSEMTQAVCLYNTQDFRIDHNSFLDLGGDAVVMWSGNNLHTCGVIDHNMIYNVHGHEDLANYLQSTVSYGIQLHRDYRAPFETKESMLGKYTDHSIFIENNYFSKWRHAVSANHGAFYIFRYNVVNEDWGHMCLDIHGKRDSQSDFAGGQGFEVYENRFLNIDDDGSVRSYWQIAGGYGVWFNNYIDSSGWNTNCGLYVYPEDPNGYPSTTWHTKDFYFWSDTGPYNPTFNGVISGFSASRNVFADWNRQAGNPGDANYPNVDPSWSIAGYQPYQYPHPLTLTT